MKVKLQERVVTLKNYSILQNKLFLVSLLTINLFSSTLIQKGDKEFLQENYTKALHYYLKADDTTQVKLKYRIIQSYLRIGDNFNKLKNYDTALKWYKKAAKLKNRNALTKMGVIYEHKADIYKKLHKYKKALVFYEKALKLKNKNLKNKILSVEKSLAHQKKLAGDTRVLVTKDSPSWTHSIGKLIIPTKLEFLSKTKYKTNHKKCSATLINLENNKNSRFIITASHCLSKFNPKAGQIKFIIKNKQEKMIYRIAKIELNSNFNIKKMKTTTDIALLSLNRSIVYKDVKPLLFKEHSFSTLQNKYRNSFGSLGGFSSDIAEFGAKLTYDPKCKLTEYSRTYSSSTCKGFKGSSGGPIVLTTTKDNKTFHYHFVGVVSHFKNTKFENIFFAPHHLLYYKIQNIIKNY